MQRLPAHFAAWHCTTRRHRCIGAVVCARRRCAPVEIRSQRRTTQPDCRLRTADCGLRAAGGMVSQSPPRRRAPSRLLPLLRPQSRTRGGCSAATVCVAVVHLAAAAVGGSTAAPPPPPPPPPLARVPAGLLATVPRNAFTLRDFTLLLTVDPDAEAAASATQAAQLRAAALASTPVRACLTAAYPDPAAPIFDDRVGRRGDAATTFLATALLERHASLFGYAACLVSSPGAASPRALARYGAQLLLSCVSGTGLAGDVLPLAAALLTAVPDVINATMDTVDAGVAGALPAVGYTVLHNVFDQNKIVFRHAVNSVLRDAEAGPYLRDLQRIAAFIAGALPPDMPQRAAVAARMRAAVTALVDGAHVTLPPDGGAGGAAVAAADGAPRAASQRRLLAARHLYVLSDGLATLAMDVLTAPLRVDAAAADGAVCARLTSLARVVRTPDAFGRNALHMAALTSNAALALLAARVTGAVAHATRAASPCAAAAAAQFAGAAAAADLFGYSPTDVATATLADEAVVMPPSLPTLAALTTVAAPAYRALPAGRRDGDGDGDGGSGGDGAPPGLPPPLPLLGRRFAHASARDALPAGGQASTPPRTAAGWREPLRVSPLAAAALAADAATPLTHCDIDTVDVAALPGASAEERHAALAVRFLLDYFIPNRPLRIRNYHGLDAVAPAWDLPAFLAAHGDARLDFSDIPYGAVFKHASGKATIGQFTAGMLWCTADGDLAPPPPTDPLHAVLAALSSTAALVAGAPAAVAAARAHLCAAFADVPRPPGAPAAAGATAASRNYIFTRLRASASPQAAALMGAMQLTPDFLSLALPRLRAADGASAGADVAIGADGSVEAADDGTDADDDDGGVTEAPPASRLPPPRIIATVGPTTEVTLPDAAGAPAMVVGSQPLVAGFPKLHDPQFFLGVRGSGAPVHYHHDAVNFCLAGRKRWYLLPAARTEYTTVSIAEYVVHVLPHLRHDRTPLTCVQEAGDVMFVPHAWGHGVLNLATTVGYALEFPTAWQY